MHWNVDVSVQFKIYQKYTETIQKLGNQDRFSHEHENHSCRFYFTNSLWKLY